MLGESVREAIYYKLSLEGGLDPAEILADPRRFKSSLRALFGSGTFAVESLIVKEINSEFCITALTLEEALLEVRKVTIIHPFPSELR